jgi:hypothetical protein
MAFTPAIPSAAPDHDGALDFTTGTGPAADRAPATVTDIWRASASWRKSSRSGDEGACVEMAPVAPGVAVRDSKDPEGPVLLFSPAAWTAFTTTPPRS